MDQNPEIDKYAKAKIEQPFQQWPEFFRKPGGISRQKLRFFKIFRKTLKIFARLFTLPPFNFVCFCVINF